jgi:hypothetical protein
MIKIVESVVFLGVSGISAFKQALIFLFWPEDVCSYRVNVPFGIKI